jgi:pimeloyl-ACP methyl ester carboxylesterase
LRQNSTFGAPRLVTWVDEQVDRSATAVGPHHREARSSRQLRQFHHIINPDKVFGTHSGHFAAFEQPELFVRDVRSFFRRIR